ncbi:hypothetical protein LX32DRAFT_129225 [Colletotrichum zoysiae]|uniref:Uncharacterized protein n=1 Tax=Colletotrichum zoysiae TaxID=1216348 RepID=A0AAD9HSB3_9PEZI|nr:hypothetical protein LX32DRAFT_129225 [Colletotrichum zoysiae]
MILLIDCAAHSLFFQPTVKEYGYKYPYMRWREAPAEKRRTGHTNGGGIRKGLPGRQDIRAKSWGSTCQTFPAITCMDWNRRDEQASNLTCAGSHQLPVGVCDAYWVLTAKTPVRSHSGSSGRRYSVQASKQTRPDRHPIGPSIHPSSCCYRVPATTSLQAQTQPSPPCEDEEGEGGRRSKKWTERPSIHRQFGVPKPTLRLVYRSPCSF